MYNENSYEVIRYETATDGIKRVASPLEMTVGNLDLLYYELACNKAVASVIISKREDKQGKHKVQFQHNKKTVYVGRMLISEAIDDFSKYAQVLETLSWERAQRNYAVFRKAGQEARMEEILPVYPSFIDKEFNSDLHFLGEDCLTVLHSTYHSEAQLGVAKELETQRARARNGEDSKQSKDLEDNEDGFTPESFAPVLQIRHPVTKEEFQLTPSYVNTGDDKSSNSIHHEWEYRLGAWGRLDEEALKSTSRLYPHNTPLLFKNALIAKVSYEETTNRQAKRKAVAKMTKKQRKAYKEREEREQKGKVPYENLKLYCDRNIDLSILKGNKVLEQRAGITAKSALELYGARLSDYLYREFMKTKALAAYNMTRWQSRLTAEIKLERPELTDEEISSEASRFIKQRVINLYGGGSENIELNYSVIGHYRKEDEEHEDVAEEVSNKQEETDSPEVAVEETEAEVEADKVEAEEARAEAEEQPDEKDSLEEWFENSVQGVEELSDNKKRLLQYLVDRRDKVYELHRCLTSNKRHKMSEMLVYRSRYDTEDVLKDLEAIYGDEAFGCGCTLSQNMDTGEMHVIFAEDLLNTEEETSLAVDFLTMRNALNGTWSLEMLIDWYDLHYEDRAEEFMDKLFTRMWDNRFKCLLMPDEDVEALEKEVDKVQSCSRRITTLTCQLGMTSGKWSINSSLGKAFKEAIIASANVFDFMQKYGLQAHQLVDDVSMWSTCRIFDFDYDNVCRSIIYSYELYRVPGAEYRKRDRKSALDIAHAFLEKAHEAYPTVESRKSGKVTPEASRMINEFLRDYKAHMDNARNFGMSSIDRHTNKLGRSERRAFEKMNK